MATGTTTAPPPVHAAAAALLQRIKYWPDGMRRSSLAAVDFNLTLAFALSLHALGGATWREGAASATIWALAIIAVNAITGGYALRRLPAPRIWAAAIGGSALAAALGAWPEPMASVPPAVFGLCALLVAARRAVIRVLGHPLTRRRVLLLGTPEDAMALGEAIRLRPAAGLHVLGLLTDLPRLPARTGMLVLGPPHRAALVLERWGADGLVVGESVQADGPWRAGLPAGAATWRLDDVLGRLGYSSFNVPSTSRWRSKTRRDSRPRAS